MSAFVCSKPKLVELFESPIFEGLGFEADCAVLLVWFGEFLEIFLMRAGCNCFSEAGKFSFNMLGMLEVVVVVVVVWFGLQFGL